MTDMVDYKINIEFCNRDYQRNNAIKCKCQ